MSIDDSGLPDMLRSLADDMQTLHRMQDWAEGNANYDGAGLSIKWGYGQFDAGFVDIVAAVTTIVRERAAETIKEAVRRKQEQTAELHDQVHRRMAPR